MKLQQKLNYLYCPITIACFPWVEFHTFQGNNLAAKPAKKSNHPPPPHFSCLWYSLSKISFINLLFSIDRSYILDVFAALFYSKINSPQITLFQILYCFLSVALFFPLCLLLPELLQGSLFQDLFCKIYSCSHFSKQTCEIEWGFFVSFFVVFFFPCLWTSGAPGVKNLIINTAKSQQVVGAGDPVLCVWRDLYYNSRCLLQRCLLVS